MSKKTGSSEPQHDRTSNPTSKQQSSRLQGEGNGITGSEAGDTNTGKHMGITRWSTPLRLSSRVSSRIRASGDCLLPGGGQYRHSSRGRGQGPTAVLNRLPIRGAHYRWIWLAV